MSGLAVAFYVLNMQLERYTSCVARIVGRLITLKTVCPWFRKHPHIVFAVRLAPFDSDCQTSGSARKRYSFSHPGAIGTKGKYAYVPMGYDFVTRTICSRWRYTIR